ncbi:hypothetical protein [Novosphingobium guangzhouense]|uniref:Uncharacterized protein n=1 Tax=Novosphingobium guangzhouense TaxID=1850347 RepID=A0A2K2G4N1_9SPHN|nr:hypothetical protein [Novosphingobium guangzhouense]PNU05984.1 hypothetical protein A8V01_14270 [Novosphingobium guangzhouense]
MSLTALTAAVLLGQSALSLAPAGPSADQIDVAYTELATGRSQAALAKLEASGAAQSNDPATLINLGYAYAQVGDTAKALAAYRTAINSSVRYDLQLADGSWVDSRYAARRALSGLMSGRTVAAR